MESIFNPVKPEIESIESNSIMQTKDSVYKNGELYKSSEDTLKDENKMLIDFVSKFMVYCMLKDEDDFELNNLKTQAKQLLNQLSK